MVATVICGNIYIYQNIVALLTTKQCLIKHQSEAVVKTENKNIYPT